MNKYSLFLATITFALLSFKNSEITSPLALGADNTYTYDSTFVIHLYYGGGMRYESTNIYIRYDSCIYVHMEQGLDNIRSFAMTQKLREEIAQALVKHRAFSIKQAMHKELIHDKATSSICFNGKSINTKCISTGATSSIHKDYVADFNNLWLWLSDFAKRNIK